MRDPLENVHTYEANAAGQVTSVRDPFEKETRLDYEAGDLVAVTNPLAERTELLVDAAGRVRSVKDPLGRVTRYEYDVLDRVTRVVDPISGATVFGYDPNSNLTSVTDARQHTTTYGYDSMDRLASRIDPVPGRPSETFGYDGLGNFTSWTDRKGQVMIYMYDPLNRQKFVGFKQMGAMYESTITSMYDAGNRLRQIVDNSGGGTITRDYDGLDNLGLETTPLGAVAYTYDDAGRRETMTVTPTGQAATGYTYVFDEADRLTRITRGAAVVMIVPDQLGRRQSVMNRPDFPGGSKC